MFLKQLFFFLFVCFGLVGFFFVWLGFFCWTYTRLSKIRNKNYYLQLNMKNRKDTDYLALTG